MTTRLTAILLFLSLVYPATSCGCRVNTIDPLSALAHPEWYEEVIEVFVGEIVGVRSNARLAELKRCLPRDREPQDPDGEERVFACLETAPTIDLEIYPTEVLKGQPEFPASVRATGCTSLSPRVGSKALVLRTTISSQVRVFNMDEPDYPHSYNEEYLRKVRECSRGKCAASVEE